MTTNLMYNRWVNTFQYWQLIDSLRLMKYYDFSQCILNPYLYFSFSAKVFFTLRGDKKEYNSTVQTFRNKKMQSKTLQMLLWSLSKV